MCLLADPVAERVWLDEPSAEALLAPVYGSGADIGSHDVCSRLLLVAAASHGWEFPSFQMPPLLAERSRWKHLPRLLLSGGQVLRTERWTIDRATIERTNAARGAALPGLAQRNPPDRRARPGPRSLWTVRAGAAAAYRQPAGSALPVRYTCCPCAVARARRLPGSPEDWPVRDAQGKHYLAELAVSWIAEEYWQAVVPTRST